MTFSDWIPLISVSISFISVIFVVRNSKRNDIADIERRASENAVINTKLDNIQTNVSGLSIKTDLTDNNVGKLTERMVAVEESTKSAHRRIDGVEERVGKFENS